MTSDYGQLITALSGGEPVDLIIDGIFSPASIGENGMPQGYCFLDNGEGVSFLNLNAYMGSAPEEMMANKSDDMRPFACELPAFDTSEHDAWLAE